MVNWKGLVSGGDEWLPIDTLEKEESAGFDVLAKYWDPVTTDFMYQRFCGCFQDDGVILWTGPFWKPYEGQKRSDYVKLTERGYKPVYWMRRPKMPSKLRTKHFRREFDVPQ